MKTLPPKIKKVKDSQRIVIVQTDTCKLEHFEPELVDKEFRWETLIHNNTLPGRTIEERYSLLVSAVMNYAIRKGCYIDDDAQLIMRAHDIGNRFPILKGDEWEEWFLCAMARTYEEIIQHMTDQELVPTTRVIYRVKSSTFYAMTEEEMQEFP